MDISNQNSLDQYQKLLEKVSQLTYAIELAPSLIDNQNINGSIQRLTEARDLICQLCDAEGRIKEDVANTIAENIKPDVGNQLSEMDDMQKALSCLSSIFSTIHYIALIDRVVDSVDPENFSRTKCNDEEGNENLTNDVVKDFLNQKLLQTPESSMPRRVLVDIIYDMYNLLKDILTAIRKNPIWGANDSEQMRLDKFCDQNGRHFINFAAIVAPISSSAKTSLHVGIRPEHLHLTDLVEILSQQMKRFRYLLRMPD